MPVNLSAPNPADLHPVAGVELGITMAGVRKANRRDLLVVKLAPGTSVAGVFTQNRFCAAPVQVCREHLGGAALGLDAPRLPVVPGLRVHDRFGVEREDRVVIRILGGDGLHRVGEGRVERRALGLRVRRIALR